MPIASCITFYLLDHSEPALHEKLGRLPMYTAGCVYELICNVQSCVCHVYPKVL